jgi:hypothetical protein
MAEASSADDVRRTLAATPIAGYFLSSFPILNGAGRMRMYLSLTAITALALAGCATGSLVNQHQDPVMVMVGNSASLQYKQDVRVITQSVAGTPASLWAKLNAAYSNLALPVTERDSADFAVAAQNAQFSGRFGPAPMSRVIDCGVTPFGTQRANAYRVWLSVATQLQPSGTGTNVRTSVAAKAQDPNSSTAAIQCGSTGALEADIATALGAQ